MAVGYNVYWTEHALNELNLTFDYLENTFSIDVLTNLAQEIEIVIWLITQFPFLFPEVPNLNGIRRVVVLKYNTLYYRVDSQMLTIEILSFFSNRQNPDKVVF